MELESVLSHPAITPVARPSSTKVRESQSQGSGSRIRVLLIEDDPGYADLITLGLSKEKDSPFEVQGVGTLRGGLDHLANGGTDIILLDLFLPDSRGIDTLTRIQAQAPLVPVIVLTACVDETLELGVLRKGAQDYLDKGQVHPKMLSRVIRYAIQRERAEKALRASQERLKQEKEEAERLAQQLEQTLKQLKTAQQLVIQREKALSTGEFAAIMAHEIRNPLSIISMSIQYLQSKMALKDRHRTFAQTIVRKLEQLTRLGQRLASLGSPLGSRRLRNLNRCLDRSLELFKVRCDAQRIEVVRRYDERLPLVLLDIEQMEQVFANLFTNALDALPHGGRLTVTTWSDPKRHSVGVTISDTGPGIAKRFLPQLFTPFVTTKKAKGGTGLGLSICQRIIAQHEGRIEIASSTAKRTHGTTVTVVLAPPPP